MLQILVLDFSFEGEISYKYLLGKNTSNLKCDCSDLTAIKISMKINLFNYKLEKQFLKSPTHLFVMK